MSSSKVEFVEVEFVEVEFVEVEFVEVEFVVRARQSLAICCRRSGRAQPAPAGCHCEVELGSRGRYDDP